MKAFVTRKIGMTSTIDELGAVIPVTLLLAEPNVVTQIKTIETDGYQALQVGTGKLKNPGKAILGHVKNQKSAPKYIREFTVKELPEDLKVGDQIGADSFNIGDAVQVTGISKGKGWGGVIKRHGFQRGRKTHGGGSYRRPGSIGSMYPQKVFKGKRMAGQTGNAQISVKNLKVALVDSELNIIGVKGAVPGPKRGIVLVRGKE